jgi:palmitoyltransferase
MFMTTFYNMAINYTTVETMQKGSTYNIALLKSKNPASSQPNPMQSNVIREVQRGDSRSYIVVQTQHGENPWDRGVWQNVRDVMGERVVDWFSWKMGPCTVHNDHSGEFAWGSVVKKMMDQHGAGSPHKRSSRPRSRRRQSSATTTPR